MRASEIVDVLKNEIASIDQKIEFEEVGQVVKVFDGIAIAYGLDNVEFNEIVQFENGTQGIVFNIEEDNVGIVILGDDKNIKEGQVIKREKQFFKVPTGKSLLGRVVDVFGNPLDNKGELKDVVYKKADSLKWNFYNYGLFIHKDSIYIDHYGRMYSKYHKKYKIDGV